jgi:hypothetical protein
VLLVVSRHSFFVSTFLGRWRCLRLMYSGHLVL